MKGLFLTLEGIDGAGKSSHIDALEALFKAQAAAGGDPWPSFYAQVKKLAQQPKAQRDAALDSEPPRADGSAPAGPLKATASGGTGS